MKLESRKCEYRIVTAFDGYEGQYRFKHFEDATWRPLFSRPLLHEAVARVKECISIDDYDQQVVDLSAYEKSEAPHA